MANIAQISPTGNEIPFSVWHDVYRNRWDEAPCVTRLVAAFAYLQEALDYIRYCAEHGSTVVLRGLYGSVSVYPPEAGRLLSTCRSRKGKGGA